MKIFLQRMKLYGYHGVLPQEQVVGSYFYVSAEVTTPNSVACQTDELSDTISYADIADVIRKEMAVRSKLLEHVAGRIARRLKEDYPAVCSVTVRVEKENPPMGIECQGAGVEVSL